MRMRKKKHGSERLASLSALICSNPAILRENPRSVFEKDSPLCLEIGCGKGDFVKQLSVAVPDYNYFAMEKVDDVLVVAVDDRPGGIAPILSALAEGHIDIEYMYSLFTHIEGKAYIVFRVAEAEKFVALLGSHGITPSSNEELGIH